MHFLLQMLVYQLQYVMEDQAVLSRGPAVGTEVVSAGAAELFGTEFGVGK